MTSKLFEIRDRGTAMVALAVRLDADSPESARLLRAAGYGDHPEQYVVLISIRGGVSEAQDDPFAWANPRTMGQAHRTIMEQFETLPNGAVVDVRVAYGEADAPARSDFPA